MSRKTSKKMGAPLRFPDEPTGKALCDKIIELRRTLGLSQADLGAKVGVSGEAVCKWETGKTAPSGPALKILKQLGGKDWWPLDSNSAV